MPEQIIVVANRAVPDGLDLAHHYMKQRSIPQENLLLIETTRREHIGRADYDKEIAVPVRAAQADRGGLHQVARLFS
jgi:uncharacterized protein (TIGR03790 family)